MFRSRMLLEIVQGPETLSTVPEYHFSIFYPSLSTRNHRAFSRCGLENLGSLIRCSGYIINPIKSFNGIKGHLVGAIGPGRQYLARTQGETQERSRSQEISAAHAALFIKPFQIV